MKPIYAKEARKVSKSPKDGAMVRTTIDQLWLLIKDAMDDREFSISFDIYNGKDVDKVTKMLKKYGYKVTHTNIDEVEWLEISWK
jgi:hypothetical protein